MAVISTVPISKRLIHYRWRQFLIVLVISAALSGCVIGVAAVRDTSTASIQASVRTNHAERAFAIQAGGEQANDALSHIAGLDGVAEKHGFVRHSGHQVSVVIRVSRQPDLPLQVLVEGRRAHSTTEATLSLAAASALGAHLGATFDVESDSPLSTTRQLVGITANPADLGDQTVVLVDPALAPGEVTVWLSDKDPFTVPAVRGLLDQHRASYQTIDLVAAESGKFLPPGLTGLKYVPVGLALLLFVILGAVMVALFPAARRDTYSLMDAGVSARDSWRIVSTLALATVATGQTLGIVVVIALLWLARGPISGLFGQNWQQVMVPWPSIVWLAAGGLLLLLLLRPILLARANVLRAMERKSATQRPSIFSWLILGTGAIILLGALRSHLQERPGDFSRLAPVAALLVAGGMPAVISPLALWGLPMATRVIANRLARGLSAAMVVVNVLAVGVAGHTAQVIHDSLLIESASRAPQPAGSLVVSEMPGGAADQLTREYRDLGGKRVAQFELPEERQTNLRVTSTRLTECMSRADTRSPGDVPDDCFPQQTYSPINTVALSREISAGPSADPGLLANGRVGLLLFTGTDGQVARLATTDAESDDILGGNLPGLVVPLGGEVAKRFRLTPAGTRTVALLDFGTLSAANRSLIRGSIDRLAPAAQTVDASGTTGYERRRSVAVAVALSGAGLVLLLLLVSGWAVLVANRATRRVLVDVGASRSRRHALGFRWVVGPMACLALSFPLVVSSVWISTLKQSASLGWVWTAPLVAGLIGCLVLAVRFLSVPDRIGE
ncbi:membrane hypothetical protein [metagenome]|uniref:ABC3 transporter permease protein domain-containing protein n=1 Tax=metagenome TaxID=256318 RepID=A0A2P2C327_9ZZZZ